MSTLTFKYEYLVSSKSLTKVGEGVADESEIGFDNVYPTTESLTQPYIRGVFTFDEKIVTPVESIYSNIMNRLYESGVEFLAKSDLLSEASEKKLPSEVKKTSKLSMKKDGEVKTVSITEFDTYVSDGWTPVKKEYRDYPIIVDPITEEIKFTIYEEELPSYDNSDYLIFRYKK